MVVSDGTVDNGDIATNGGHCSKVLFSTWFVRVYQANILVLRLRLYHPLHMQGKPGPVVTKTTYFRTTCDLLTDQTFSTRLLQIIRASLIVWPITHLRCNDLYEVS